MATAPPKFSLPMLYRGLQALDPVAHLGLGISSQMDFAYAESANAIPLGIGEFWQASAHYPIVFGPAGSSGFPIVITALREGRNLFVDAHNQWLDGVYVPNWLKRHPFWVQLSPDKQRANLWFDSTSQRIVPLQDDEDAQPLFDYTGHPNLALERIIALCKQCDDDAVHTAAFMQALEQHHLLVERTATMELSPGQPYTLKGFRIIDVEAYHRLPDAILAQWLRNGWAGLIELHRISMQHNWGKLLALHVRQNH